ncbi:MAG: response regulator transcription factor [Paludibacter sp.]|nr:response regulator transcription factor [Paludibacter sp.]
MNRNINIIVVEPSPLVSEGLAGILQKSEIQCQIAFKSSLEDIEQILAKKKYEIIIINPLLTFSNSKTFSGIITQFNLKSIGLIYAHFDPSHLQMFDATITVSDASSTIITTINKLLTELSQHGQNELKEALSKREIDVLKLLANGMSNKEIADKLYISTHTVITHRKNLSHKTGIKSVSGLTIYAVVQKLVSIETLSEL